MGVEKGEEVLGLVGKMGLSLKWWGEGWMGDLVG